jgi:heat shock protein HtpX
MRKSLQDQIRANQRGSLFFSFLIVLLLAGLGMAIAGSMGGDYWWVGGAIAAGIGLVSAFIAYTAGSKIVLQISGAREATRQEDLMLANVVEEMAIAAGIPRPKIYVIDEAAPNAFATGNSPKNGVVVFTKGLIEKLNRDELQGVAAHEIAHIRNYDMRFMTVIAIVAGFIPLLADMFRYMLWTGGGRRGRSDSRDGGQIIWLVIGIALMILAPIFAKLLELAVSRKREFMADATAAELTRYPEGLAQALLKISGDQTGLEHANRATQHMYIVNPFHPLDRVQNLFSTHPSVDARVKALRGLMGAYPKREVSPGFEDMPEIPEQRNRT